MSIINLLASRNFIVVNKDVAKKIGLDEAIMLGELASEYAYWDNRDELTEDGYFYSTIENVEENTTFSQYKQQKSIEKLADAGLLYVSRRGLPAKRYIKLREDNLLRLFDNPKYSDVHDEEKTQKTPAKRDYLEEFEEVWKMYPKKQGKEQARKAYQTARKEGVEKDLIVAGLKSYKAYIDERNIEDRYIKNGSTWFNQRCWNDKYEVKNQKQDGFFAMQKHDWNYDELQKLANQKIFS